ncbi:unnamed protein product [Menidia menidia]|uniref:(Atlantic silverside) hypothetical protein n=1 Tax=Menidia menidia TaxID=238744 RepID=A0A8S4AGP7_9TELE|nr:unnamed protein product [Menidia menidia]
MSGSGEVRVLRPEAVQDSPGMPAWKREILERRKAKGVGAGGTVAPDISPGGASPQRVNGEVTGNVNGNSSSSGLNKDSGATGGSGRNYTITTGSQHFANNKEPQPTATEKTTPRKDSRHESLVLQESLGPLEENPFIKLEKERRKRQDRDHAARPVQHILELYGGVPGIRTIRAENIIIIESDPDYFLETGGVKCGDNWQQNGGDSYSSLNDLLDRRGSAVTEIRAKEVVIYDTALSKSEENLSTLGRPGNEVSYDSVEGQGRVSRILQKFDSNYGNLQKKSRSTENLLDLDCSPSSRPRHWSKPQRDLVPKPQVGLSVSSPGNSQPRSPVFQGSWSSKPKPQPAVPEVSSPMCHSGSSQSVFSFRQQFEESGIHGAAFIPKDEPDCALNKLTREREWEIAETSPKPKVPCSPESRRVRAESPSSSISTKVSRSSHEYEIRPSPKPDLAKIPDGDTQAQALANLRLQSRNSFMVIPKRHPPASSSGSSMATSGTVKSSHSSRASEVLTLGMPNSLLQVVTPNFTKRKEENLQEEELDMAARTSKPETSSVSTSPAPPLNSPSSSPTQALTPSPTSPPFLVSPPSSPAAPSSPLISPLLTDSLTPALHPQNVEQLLITNIDEVEVEPPKRVPVPSPLVQRKKGNTFTVVPKRKVEANVHPGSPECQQEALNEPHPGSTPLQAPYAQLGTLLKKRYPAVEEIEVIGGYLTLDKSCLSKTGSSGKKGCAGSYKATRVGRAGLKISFNESNLQRTFEYPSESSVWYSGEEGEEDEKEKQDGKLADEQPSMVGRIHIPRPSFTVSPSLIDDGNKLIEIKVTCLTPADSSSLSDYSSEPALYF